MHTRKKISSIENEMRKNKEVKAKTMHQKWEKIQRNSINFFFPFFLFTLAFFSSSQLWSAYYVSG